MNTSIYLGIQWPSENGNETLNIMHDTGEWTPESSSENMTVDS